MTLIKSISGIRGTIGGKPGENLTPIDIVESVSAYGYWLKEKFKNESLKVVIGRDARLSGEMVENLCIGTLQSLGKISKKYSHVEQNVIDGLKLEFEHEWVHLRKSNTEPIIRIYAESKDVEKANMLASRFVEEVKSLM